MCSTFPDAIHGTPPWSKPLATRGTCCVAREPPAAHCVHSARLRCQVYAVLLLWARRYRALHEFTPMPFAMVVSSRLPTRDKPNSLCRTDHRAVARVSQQFKNSGAEAGATQQHPHSQLIGFPVVPAHTKELLSAARAHHEVNGTCVHCRMVERLQQPSEEGGSGKELVVYQNDEFVSDFVGFEPTRNVCS